MTTIYDYAATLGDVPPEAVQRAVARTRAARHRKVYALAAEEAAGEARFKELEQLYNDARAKMSECAARRPKPGTPEREAWHEEFIGWAAKVQGYHAALLGASRGGRQPDTDRVDSDRIAVALAQLSITRSQLAKELGVQPSSITHALEHPLGVTKSMYARMTEALEQIALRRAMS